VTQILDVTGIDVGDSSDSVIWFELLTHIYLGIRYNEDLDGYEAICVHALMGSADRGWTNSWWHGTSMEDLLRDNERSVRELSILPLDFNGDGVELDFNLLRNSAPAWCGEEWDAWRRSCRAHRALVELAVNHRFNLEGCLHSLIQANVVHADRDEGEDE